MISGADDNTTLQHDLDNLGQWSNKWLLHFNPEKCKVIHIGHSQQTMYQMSEDDVTHCLQSIHEKKDLGVLVADNLKPSHQCSKVVSKAMSILIIICRGFGQVDTLEFKKLYNTYVRTHLKYCIQAWSANLVTDITTLEQVQ